MSEESEREAYELRVYERQCFEKQQEETMIDAMNEEASRCLARYDEAVRMLQEVSIALNKVQDWDGTRVGFALEDIRAFLAAEPKEGEGGR